MCGCELERGQARMQLRTLPALCRYAAPQPCVACAADPPRCKALLAERDEARAETYTEAARSVEQSVEIDKLRECRGWVVQYTLLPPAA